MIMAMSGRFILALAGIALLIPFFSCRGIIATVLLIAAGLTLLSSFAQVGRQLFNDARQLVRWTRHRLIRRDRSDARTTPDRTGH